MVPTGLTHRLAEGALPGLTLYHGGRRGYGWVSRVVQSQGFSFCCGLNKGGLGTFVSFHLQSDLVELHGYIIRSDWGSATELCC